MNWESKKGSIIISIDPFHHVTTTIDCDVYDDDDNDNNDEENKEKYVWNLIE